MHALGCFSSIPNLPALAGSGSVKNSNTTVDYGTVMQDWYDDGMHINFEIRRDGIYANKIDKDGNSISQRTICTF